MTYLRSITSPSLIGKKKRLFRLLGVEGKWVIVPLDDNLISQECTGLYDLQSKIDDISQSHPNGVLCYYGTASLIRNLDLPIILNLTASTVQSHHDRKVVISNVEKAVAMDACAVAVHINICSDYESEMLENLGKISDECYRVGMPLMVLAYPRKNDGMNDYNFEDIKLRNPYKYAELVAHCVRIAFELGADIVKTQYTGSKESFSKVVLASSGKPILIAGGPLCNETDFYDMVENAMIAGASGVSVGRNIFNRKNSSDVINNIKRIVFSNIEGDTDERKQF